MKTAIQSLSMVESILQAELIETKKYEVERINAIPSCFYGI